MAAGVSREVETINGEKYNGNIPYGAAWRPCPMWKGSKHPSLIHVHFSHACCRRNINCLDSLESLLRAVSDCDSVASSKIMLEPWSATILGLCLQRVLMSKSHLPQGSSKPVRPTFLSIRPPCFKHYKTIYQAQELSIQGYSRTFAVLKVFRAQHAPSPLPPCHAAIFPVPSLRLVIRLVLRTKSNNDASMSF